MFFSDLLYVLQWWSIIFIIGVIFSPLTNLVFPYFLDRGYVFSKIIGVAFVSYAVFILGITRLISFETLSIIAVIGIFTLVNIFILKKGHFSSRLLSKPLLGIYIFEEILFLINLIFWSFIHSHQPDIHGLEKYMDFGFINSILRSSYFPPSDMWLSPLSINYYYFGHLVTAILTKLSYLPSHITYNLMLATISALSFVFSFSIGANLINLLLNDKENRKKLYTLFLGGLLTAFIVCFAGNLHAIYSFFLPYPNETPVPPWQLSLSLNTFQNSYWYPNATRFIYNTIHEFPIYSFVVSDLHGHVLDIPFVLLTIAVLFSIITNIKYQISNIKSLIGNWPAPRSFGEVGKLEIGNLILIGFLLAIMYMTNAWDGIIYLLLTAIIIFVIQFITINSSANKGIKYYVLSIIQNKKYMIHATYYMLLIIVGFFIFSLPFNINFKPFASGIGIQCAPKFLTDIGRIGPFLFEKDHCLYSPIWQLLILYGFFYFWVISFIIFLFSKIKRSLSDIFVVILIILSTLLIIVPEIIYVKDIYPAHYRANTMFKLVYQSFMMLSLSSGYIIIRLLLNLKSSILNQYLKLAYWIIGLFVVLIVFLYPFFAINSYFGNLKTYSGLDGTKYLKLLYPTDYEAILWINKNIEKQPVILEAQGDSYTDYGRISANTGLPTVLGWTVHEWLWRGTYDIPAPRISEITKMYESENLKETKTLLKKYNVSLVFIGNLERQKYPNLNEEKFSTLGKIIYENGDTKIYLLNN